MLLRIRRPNLRVEHNSAPIPAAHRHDSLREDLIDIVIIDLDRIALEHHPALVGDLIPSIPPWPLCFSDVTGARNLITGLTKEAMDTKPSLVIFKARDKPIRIGPVALVVVDKAE